MNIEAVIFDLDGVIVSTDEYHYLGWKHLADEEGIYFDRNINQRLRGVSRMHSLEILLEKSSRVYTQDEKNILAERKNSYYKKLIENITPKDILAGVMKLLSGLKAKGIKIAIASSSKNSPAIMRNIGLAEYFDAHVSGNDITKSKPDPQIFLMASQRLGIIPEKCLVVEDARSGVEAALAAGMRVVGIGQDASQDKRATLNILDLSDILAENLLSL